MAPLKISQQRKQKRNHSYNLMDEIETQVFNPKMLLLVDLVQKN